MNIHIIEYYVQAFSTLKTVSDSQKLEKMAWHDKQCMLYSQ